MNFFARVLFIISVVFATPAFAVWVDGDHVWDDSAETEIFRRFDRTPADLYQNTAQDLAVSYSQEELARASVAYLRTPRGSQGGRKAAAWALVTMHEKEYGAQGLNDLISSGQEDLRQAAQEWMTARLGAPGPAAGKPGTAARKTWFDKCTLLLRGFKV